MRLPFVLECVARVSSSKQLTLQEELRRAFQNENWKRNLSELLLTFPLFLFFFFSSVWPSVKMDKFILILTNFQKYKPKYNYKYKSRLAPDSGRDGSMESIDEHCKNFATSSWTQFKVPLNQTFIVIINIITIFIFDINLRRCCLFEHSSASCATKLWPTWGFSHTLLALSLLGHSTGILVIYSKIIKMRRWLKWRLWWL